MKLNTVHEFSPPLGPDPWLTQLLLSIALLLVCLVCMACLILVLMSIRLVARSTKDSIKLEKEKHKGSTWDGEKIIKGITDPLHHLIDTAHNHLSSFTHNKNNPTSPLSTPPLASAKPTLPSAMTSQLQDVATVATSQQDIVFHVTPEGYISYWSSKSKDERDNLQYNSENLKIEGNKIFVNKELPILAAVAYKDGSDQDVVRVFFLDQNRLKLREIRRVGTSSAKWTYGETLNSKGWKVDGKSGLTANVVKSNGQVQLKVFYQEEANQLSVAYSVLAVDNTWSVRDDWSSRENVTE